jgi:hypothetical protein
MRSIRSRLLVPVSLATLVVAGCGGDELIAPAAEDIRDYITALATSGGIDAVFHAGPPPATGSGPTIIIDGASAMITGGSSIRGVSSAQAFTRIVVAINSVDGYWEITLPAAVTLEEIVLTLAQTLPTNAFTVRYAAGSSGGVGTFDSEPVTVLVVGTGVLQVSVTWDSSADVDLYVVEPGATGEEIYYGNSSSVAGGTLDLDSNAACAGDNVRNENITWPNSAPSGTYTIRVNLWDACSTTTTNYVVTLRRQNQAPQTFSGVLNAPGNNGASGAGTVVTTFTF